MKAFFTASYSAKKTHQKIYDKIVSHLQLKNIQVISQETGNPSSSVTQKINKKFIIKAISQSDLCIFEASNKSFKIGYETCLALSQNRPTLCLSDSQDFSDYIDDPLFSAVRYSNINELVEAIDRFISHYENQILSVRYNCMITPKQFSKLEAMSKKQGKPTSEIVRGLIERMKNEE